MARFTRVLVLIALALVPISASAGPGEDASDVIDKWAAAMTAHDQGGVLKLYAPDAILHGTTSPIMSEGTAAISAYFSVLAGSSIKIAIGERRMVVLSEDTVLGTGFYGSTLMPDGQPAARFTMILVKRDGNWLILHHHSSLRPKPTQ
jgi:uncharacterized protein (TIGR02246 family)